MLPPYSLNKHYVNNKYSAIIMIVAVSSIVCEVLWVEAASSSGSGSGSHGPHWR